MAYLFDEVNDDIVFAGNASLKLSSGEWAIAGWVKLTDNIGTVTQYIMSSAVAGTNPAFNWFIVEASNSVTGDRNELTFRLEDDSTHDTANVTSTGQPFLSNTSWTHILIQRVSNTITQYINGSADGAITISPFSSVTMDGGLYFASRADENADRFLGGNLAEFAKWDRSLNTAEITALKNGYSPMFFLKSLIWYIPLVRTLQDVRNGLTIVTHDSPTISNHPRIIRPDRGRASLHTMAISTQDIILSGISSTSSIGTQSIEMNITASGLSSTTSIGTYNLVTDDTINLSGLDSSNAFGTAVVSRDNTIDMSGVPSISAFGTSIVANTQIITLTGIDSSSSFGTSSLSNTTVLVPVGLDNSNNFGEFTIANTQIIALIGIDSTLSFGSTQVADIGFRKITPDTGDFEQQLW